MMRFWIQNFCIFLFVFCSLFRPCFLSGMFEMRLISYENADRKDERGFCCSETTDFFADPKGGPGAAVGTPQICPHKCSVHFRICLKQYQNVISASDGHNCTYGNRTVPYNRNHGFGTVADQSLLFPFPFAWIGDLTLILEVWHAPRGFTGQSSTKTAPKSVPSNRVGASGDDDPSSSRKPRAQLLLRIAQRKTVGVDPKWTYEKQSNDHGVLELRYRVMCDEHYYGAQCADYCKPRDDTFGHFYCDTSGHKICMEGWTGSACSIAKCLPGCHPEHGTCARPNECLCRMGFTGQFCDECLRYPGCQHGTCKEPFECNCKEGWGGLFCNQDLNYCTHHKPCLNGATCTNTGAGHYTCACRLGYTGVNCEVKIETCTLKPCFNGATCRESGTNYTCLCNEGYSGKHCQTLASSCTDKPCENGASCMNAGLSANSSEGGYKCLCAPGWEGTNCDIEMDMCHSLPCINGGSCVSHFGSFTCLCPTGFLGDRCEINRNDCSAMSCLNGGTCMDEVDNFKCVCKAGFFGTLCQSNVDDCIKRPCANGGVCFDLVNDYKCECRPGFKGKDCSVDINECESNPCRYGATCEDLVHDYTCHCLPCYSGKDCRQRDDQCLWSIPTLTHPMVAGPALRRDPIEFEDPRRMPHSREQGYSAAGATVSNSMEATYHGEMYGGRILPAVPRDGSQAMAVGSNLPLVIGIPLIVIFVVIMVALIVIIFFLLRRNKNALPAGCRSRADEEARLENLRNIQIAAKQCKNRPKNDNVIYNNSTNNHFTGAHNQNVKTKGTSKDNRLSITAAAYNANKKAPVEPPDSEYTTTAQFFEQRAKNLNVATDPALESKVYKIVSMEKLQPLAKQHTITGNMQATASYDSIDDCRENPKERASGQPPSSDERSRSPSPNKNPLSDKDYAVLSPDHQNPTDLSMMTSSFLHCNTNERGGSTIMTVGQMDPMRTENLRAPSHLSYPSLHPIHRHHGHFNPAGGPYNDPNEA